MASKDDLQAKLKAGIEAARTGDRARARQLLTQVTQADPDNELAWMWLASSTDDLAERRRFLQRALQINPNNTRAREALEKLGGEAARAQQSRQQVADLRRMQGDPSARRAAPPGMPPGTRLNQQGVPEMVEPGGGLNPMLLVIGLLVVLGIGAAVVAAVVLTQPRTPQVSLQQFNAALDQTANAPTLTPRATNTSAIRIVTIDPNLQPTLPPTFTPTDTPTPTATLTPTLTPYPVSAFIMFFTSAPADGGAPDLYQANGDGSGETRLGGDIADVAIDIAGQRILFVRPVSCAARDGTTIDAPEIFTASLDNPGGARQITSLCASETGDPAWAPDGIQLVFSSNYDGNPELFTMTEDGNNVRQLTSTDGSVVNRDPVFSPDGNYVVFVSDRSSPGQTKLFSLEFAAPDTTLRQLNTYPGISYDPTFSPDGRHLAFVNDSNGQGDIYLADADGSNVLRLTTGVSAESRMPAFTPDSRLVVFVANRDGDRFQLYAVDLRGREVTRLTTSDRDDQSVTFRPVILFQLAPAP